MDNPLLKPRYHEFPVHGVKVKIRNISEKERAEITGDDDDSEMGTRRLVSLALVEVDGQPVNMTPEEVAEMGFDYFKPIVQATNKHCGFVEDAPGNSPAASDTSTDSPTP